ncbi:MAG: hypothetical protein EOO27_20700 [Comamonadaceae bacterium]|nr:MAG: hypothetical protein EOO27_20700 [Comamonadaceae bacterium]
MPTIKNKINGGLATCDEALAERLLATDSWVAYDPKPEPTPEPEPTPAPRRRRSTQKPVEEPAPEE